MDARPPLIGTGHVHEGTLFRLDGELYAAAGVSDEARHGLTVDEARTLVEGGLAVPYKVPHL